MYAILLKIPISWHKQNSRKQNPKNLVSTTSIIEEKVIKIVEINLCEPRLSPFLSIFANEIKGCADHVEIRQGYFFDAIKEWKEPIYDGFCDWSTVTNCRYHMPAIVKAIIILTKQTDERLVRDMIVILLQFKKLCQTVNRP